MPTKTEFAARIAAELKARKAQKAAKANPEYEYGGYVRAKGNGRGKKCLNVQFYQC